MQFAVIAQGRADYGAWMAHELEDAQEPATDQALQGKQLFETKACALCHTIRGTLAQGRVGPDLTHVGSRLGLAADTLPNNTGSLEAWVTHAQSLKPESLMPDITEFDGSQLRALVAHLQQLR